MTSRTTRSQSQFKKSSDRLSPEVLLSIFLTLTSEEIVSLRRVCKKWLDVIDTNKLLWRNLEWTGKSKESIEKAVEMFDEKSSSSLEMVLIEDTDWTEDLQQVVTVVSRSAESLKSLSAITLLPSLIMDQLLELANSSPNLEKLVLWNSQEGYRQTLPLIYLTSKRNGVYVESSSSRLKVLWLFSSSSESITQILELPPQLVNSLISFGLFAFLDFQEIRALLVKFSESIIHLKLTVSGDGGPGMQQPLFCPNLRILDGIFQPSVSLYFDCPNLKHRVFWFGPGSGLRGIPSSVEQLWLNSDGRDVTDEFWEPLLSSCPRMQVLKLRIADPRRSTNLQLEALVRVLEKRQEMVKKGEEIQDLPVVPLQKLVLPLNLLSEDQLERVVRVTGEVVDIQDYPDFVELEY